MGAKGEGRWTESKFTKYFCKCVEKCNAFTIPIVGSAMQLNGVPDRYIVHKRFRGWIEFKADWHGLRDVQRAICTKLIERGDTVFIGAITRLGLFEVRNINGQCLISTETLPYTGRDAEMGLKFIEMLEAATHLTAAEHTPMIR